MSGDTLEERLARAEGRIEVLLEQQNPPPKSIWRRLASIETLKNLVFLVAFPASLFLAFEKFDREILSVRENRILEQKNIAIDRLDQLQDLNSEIYQLQSQDKGDVAFAIIEAKRGQMARLTDTVYTTWVKYSDMFGRYDLNALAEALLVQKRTEEALQVANSVQLDGLRPIDRIDQNILKARILFSEGPAHDMEAARDILRAAMATTSEIERVGQQYLMIEKIGTIRLSNEWWRNTDCGKLMEIAEPLRAVHKENMALGAYEDRFGVGFTLAGVEFACSDAPMESVAQD